MAMSGLLITFVGMFLVAITTAKNAQNGGSTDSLVYLGTASGSGFFADKTRRPNWNSAKQFCNEAGMQLASIKTSEQVALLKAHNITGENIHFWTAGRDAQTLSQFVWDQTAEPLNGEILELTNIAPLGTCLVYYLGVVHSRACGDYTYFICEVVL